MLAGGNYQEAGALDLCPLPRHNESAMEKLSCIIPRGRKKDCPAKEGLVLGNGEYYPPIPSGNRLMSEVV